MTGRISDRDRAFLARHRALGQAQTDDDVRGSSELIEITGEIRRHTDSAVLIFDGARTDWVPKSQVKIGKTSDGVTYTLAMPEWLAKKKGFI